LVERAKTEAAGIEPVDIECLLGGRDPEGDGAVG